MLHRFTFAALLAWVCVGCVTVPARSQSQKEIKLTILHTNDTHGHLLPYSYPDTYDSESEIAQLKEHRNIGGAARRATLVNRIRKEKGHDTLLIDAGDICDGTPFSTEYKGEADMAAMNAIGYDLACPGNHEFNVPLEQIRKLISQAKFPYLNANTMVKEDSKLLFQPYVIKQVGTAKVAFFGLLTYSARTYPAARNDLIMEKPIEIARQLVPDLRKHADLVVAVTHDGIEEDEQMAREVPGIDIIVGGHSHTLLPEPRFVPASTTPGQKPGGVNGTIIVQDFQWAGTLGRLDLTIKKQSTGGWAVDKYSGELLPVTSTIPEDPAVAAVVDKFWKLIASKYGEVIGQATGDFTKKGPDSAEYNLVCDAVREAVGTEFELENQAGVRNPLIKGPITLGDLQSLDPFNNTIITFVVPGKQLKLILLGRRPHVSGIRYRVQDGKLVEATVNGQPIQDDAVYKGATNSYFANTPLLRDIPGRLDTGKPRFDAILAYIKKRATVTPAYDGRRVIGGERDTDLLSGQ